MNKVRGGRVPGDGMLIHERWWEGGPDHPPDPPVDPPLNSLSMLSYWPNMTVDIGT